MTPGIAGTPTVNRPTERLLCPTMVSELPPASRTDNNSFAVQLAAVPDHLRTSRHELAQWLRDVRVPVHRLHDISLAVGEAVTNAIEHGSRLDASQVVSVQAFVQDEILNVTVDDPGCWSNPAEPPITPSQHRGRGLFLIHELANKVDIHNSPHGTRVTMQFDVSEETA